MKLGIVGYGYVGKSLARVFSRCEHELTIYDTAIPDTFPAKARINDCELVFVAVPTPQGVSGECDLSAVEEVVDWVESPICIKSTVPPGTVSRLAENTGKNITFSPEYVGETPFHKYAQATMPDLIVVGGDASTSALVIRAFREAFGPEPRYFVTNAVTAELSKYMENCFFAAKLTFVAQFYELAGLFGADFTQLREIWTADTRVGRSHSIIIDRPGFGGRCLPKDLSAIIRESERRGGCVDFLQAIEAFNGRLRDKSHEIT